MRTEEGIIRSIGNGRAVVEVKKTSVEECARCGICVSAGDMVKLVELKAVPGLAVGKKVTLQLDSLSPYKGMIFLLFLPLVAFISGCILGIKVEFILPGDANLRMGLFGTVFFSLSLALAGLYDRYARSKGLLPPAILSVEGEETSLVEAGYAEGDK